MQEYNDGKVARVDPIVKFLYEWFAHHVVEVDAAMAEFVRERHEGV